MNDMTRQVEELGTVWPVPVHWSRTDGTTHKGDEGLLALTIDEGFLIDPARCRTAASERPAGWALVQTRNGVAMVGEYAHGDAVVLVYAVRIEEVPGNDWLLPELRATYVFRGAKTAHLVSAVRQEVETGRVDASRCEFDQHGHLAMGPVPIHRTWRPQGAWVDNAKEFARTPHLDAYLMLVGGGWLDFSDSSECCGMRLNPLAWKTSFGARCRDLIAKIAGNGAVATETGAAAVWGHALGGEGISYRVQRASGRTATLGAAWIDAFQQAWHLQYWLDATHGLETEEALRSASDHTS